MLIFYLNFFLIKFSEEGVDFHIQMKFAFYVDEMKK